MNKNYNTFLVIDTKSNKVNLVTSSSRKAISMLQVGKRLEVWNRNGFVETIYTKTKKKMNPYIQLEKDYIREKQQRAEEKNRKYRR